MKKLHNIAPLHEPAQTDQVFDCQWIVRKIESPEFSIDCEGPRAHSVLGKRFLLELYNADRKNKYNKDGLKVFVANNPDLAQWENGVLLTEAQTAMLDKLFQQIYVQQVKDDNPFAPPQSLDESTPWAKKTHRREFMFDTAKTMAKLTSVGCSLSGAGYTANAIEYAYEAYSSPNKNIRNGHAINAAKSAGKAGLITLGAATIDTTRKVVEQKHVSQHEIINEHLKSESHAKERFNIIKLCEALSSGLSISRPVEKLGR